MIYQPELPGRVCRICGYWKPISDFQKNSRCPEGVTYLCRICDNLQSMERYRANRDKRMETMRKHRAEHIEELRVYDRARNKTEHRREYDKQRSRRRRKTTEYREARRQYQSRDKWRSFFREYQKTPQSRAYMRAYRKLHPEQTKAVQIRRRARVRCLPNTFSSRDWIKCLEYWGNSCAVCGRAGDDITLAADHWIPIADPRPDNPGTVPQNILPLCHGKNGCNTLKNDNDPVEWLEKRFGKHKARQILARIEAYFASLKS